MKNLESYYEKNTGATSKTAKTAAPRMWVSVTIVSLFALSNIIIPDTAPQLVVAEAQPSVNSVEEINFSSPFNNSFSLGMPFLVEYTLTPMSIPDIFNDEFSILKTTHA